MSRVYRIHAGDIVLTDGLDDLADTDVDERKVVKRKAGILFSSVDSGGDPFLALTATDAAGGLIGYQDTSGSGSRFRDEDIYDWGIRLISRELAP